MGSLKNKYNIYVEFSVNEYKVLSVFQSIFCNLMCSNERTNIRSQNIKCTNTNLLFIFKYTLH